MIRDLLIQAIKILENHKFGAKTKSGIAKAKENAQTFQSTIKQLHKDLHDVLKNLWLIEHTLATNKELTKEQKTSLRTKKKQLLVYINDQIDTVVFP